MEKSADKIGGFQLYRKVKQKNLICFDLFYIRGFCSALNDSAPFAVRE